MRVVFGFINAMFILLFMIYQLDACLCVFFFIFILSRFLCLHVIDNAEFVGMPFVLSEGGKRTLLRREEGGGILRGRGDGGRLSECSE